MVQAIDSHQGREHQLVDRLIEKYGNLAWNHFKSIIDNDYSSSTAVPDASYGVSSCSAPATIDIRTVRRVLFDDTLHAGSVLVGLHADQVQARFINVGLVPPDMRFSSLLHSPFFLSTTAKATDYIAFYGFLLGKPWVSVYAGDGFVFAKF